MDIRSLIKTTIDEVMLPASKKEKDFYDLHKVQTIDDTADKLPPLPKARGFKKPKAAGNDVTRPTPNYDTKNTYVVVQKEEVEQLDEISAKTLGNYIQKAAYDVAGTRYNAGLKRGSSILSNHSDEKDAEIEKMNNKSRNRLSNIFKATSKLASKNEETAPEKANKDLKKAKAPSTEDRATNESTISLTDKEMDKREKIVKGMKKNLKSFKDRYGDNYKSVMYATATKIANEEAEQLDELSKQTLRSYIGKAHQKLSDNEFEISDYQKNSKNYKKNESFTPKYFSGYIHRNIKNEDVTAEDVNKVIIEDYTEVKNTYKDTILDLIDNIKTDLETCINLENDYQESIENGKNQYFYFDWKYTYRQLEDLHDTIVGSIPKNEEE